MKGLDRALICTLLLAPIAFAQKPEKLSGSDLLHRAALRGHTLSIEMLLKLGVEVNVTDKHGRTALHDACLKGHVNTARLLLDRGAKINARDTDGATPLHDAALGGSAPVIELLLSRGADRDARDLEGHTSLDYALKLDRTDAARALRSTNRAATVPRARARESVSHPEIIPTPTSPRPR